MESVKDFHHPYTPYDIQIELMTAIYDCITAGKIGIFESPTGTGKTLSLICSSLTWLRDAQEENISHDETAVGEHDEPRWVAEHAQIQKKKAMLERRAEIESRLTQIRAKEARQKQVYEKDEHLAKRKKANDTGETSSLDDDMRFELDEYMSDDEDATSKSQAHHVGSQGLSSTSLRLMEQLGLNFQNKSDNDDLTPVDELKIYFCSRTHSQLTQFVQEVRRVHMPMIRFLEEGEEVHHNNKDTKSEIKHIPLGSRKNLCINPKVAKLTNLTLINERCLELQKPETPKDHKCVFVPDKQNETLVHDFRDHTLASVRDIEDLGRLGREIGICPYYASRASIKPSEVVSLPYPLLLQKSSREAMNISLKGHVIIIDEAHNLMDTISNIHSISVTQTQLMRCRAQLEMYLRKFRNRLKGKNRVYVAQLVRLIDSIASFLGKKAIGDQVAEGLVIVSDLMTGKGVDQINLYKLMHYLQESRLAWKVENYANHTEEQEDTKNSKVLANVSKMPVLTHLQSFLQCLTNPAVEGRFFFEKSATNDVTLRYMLLDPTHHFREVVEEARAVILAGGTMSPMADYVHQLLSYVEPSRITTFSCGHIIPVENLIAIPTAHGPRDIEFDFTYEKRNSTTMTEALGDSIIGLASAIPDGLVVFFPSYAYIDQVILRWQTKAKGATKNTWDRLIEKKPIFCESKDTVGVDATLSEYTKSISENKGGLLLSVIGGKMSEGINFSDALGRGVVVVGLPFPNIKSAQWQAKIEYIEQTTAKRTGKKEDGKAAAKELYENACMRAVNQSIGRAIRHKGDYASIILLDKRYETQRIQEKLPGWIKQGIRKEESNRNFGETITSLKRFFKSHGEPC